MTIRCLLENQSGGLRGVLRGGTANWIGLGRVLAPDGMHCRTCREQVHAAALDNNVPGWRSRVVHVWGPGSYG